MRQHYDPLYARSQGRHLAELGRATQVACDDLKRCWHCRARRARIAAL